MVVQGESHLFSALTAISSIVVSSVLQVSMPYSLGEEVSQIQPGQSSHGNHWSGCFGHAATVRRKETWGSFLFRSL